LVALLSSILAMSQAVSKAAWTFRLSKQPSHVQ
jgi:hypothetical protein